MVVVIGDFMKLGQYKKYRKYNLILIPLLILIYSLSEEKYDIFYSLGITLLFIVMITGAWLEILIKKALGVPITNIDKFHLLFSIFIAMLIVPDLWI